METKTRNKKSAVVFLIVFAVVAAVSIIAAIAVNLFDLFKKDDGDAPHIIFYNPNFNSDIKNEPEYMALDRSIKYSDGTLTWEISNDSYDNPSDTCQAFLIKYIKALVAGDEEALKTLYSREAYKELDIPELLTEQRIYETVFTELSRTEVIENGQMFFRYEIKAEYRIQKNDGIFRSDLPSNAVKPQILIIDDRNSGAYIKGVVEYKSSNN